MDFRLFVFRHARAPYSRCVLFIRTRYLFVRFPRIRHLCFQFTYRWFLFILTRQPFAPLPRVQHLCTRFLRLEYTRELTANHKQIHWAGA